MAANHAAAIRDHLVFVLETGGIVAGVVELIPQETSLLIENLAVDPELQSKGLGAVLLEHAEHTARDKGYAQITLYTNARFDTNLIWYAKRGYRETHRTEMVPGSMTVHMAKEIELIAS